MNKTEQDALAEYVGDPTPSTCLVTCGQADGRSKLTKAAKKAGVVTDAKPLKGGALRAFVRAEAQDRGHRVSEAAGAALVDCLGEDLVRAMMLSSDYHFSWVPSRALKLKPSKHASPDCVRNRSGCSSMRSVPQTFQKR